MMTLNLLNTGGKRMLSEFETIPIEAIALSPEIMQQAIALSQNATNQWQTYLDAIAYLTICEWLHERSPNLDFAIDSEDITNHQANLHYLEVNGFTLYVLGTTPISGDMVEIPADILQPQNPISENNHNLSNTFIVIVEIYEEIEQALILGFSRHLQLVKHLADRMVDLKRDRLDDTYQLPLSLFTNEPERLLLYLQNLEPIKTLPIATITELPPVNITELILNTGLWLQEQLDEIAQNLAWHLLPTNYEPRYVPVMRSSGLRSPTQELEQIFSEVEQLNVKVPSSARAAYQDFQLGDRHLRLYATVWADGNYSTNLEANPEWSLLLVLGCQAIGEIPYGVRMQVRDQQKVLIDRQLDRKSQDLYLYACVTGDRTETFSVSISLPSGVMLTLPAFAFHPNPL
ncbi:DUF1822 family protein [Pseudanabaena sp. ABRG5-3]|uniref:DUF1822 family protein n=1 Tax=Pseudanabaena sp. ABRG5-3 TaxID=685565 RepID=UPI000DC6FB51|nr:DUF1822 family protein [Pseudanabaena sp. ABRG5-3]BBC26954.1 hypothetical protein ABRG53_c115 [Pseudanabaena sp. ABRG5-3]